MGRVMCLGRDLRVYALDRVTKLSAVTIPGITKRKGVTSLAFTADSKRLVVGLGSGGVAVADLKSKAVVESEEEEGGEEDPVAVTRLSCSADGKLLAVGRMGGRIEVWSLSGGLKKRWDVPSLHSTPTAFAYHTTAPDVLVVACVTNRFYLFDKEGKLKDWSKTLGHLIPKCVQDRADYVIGITFNPAASSEIVLYSSGSMIYLDLDKPYSPRAKIVPENHPTGVRQREAVAKARRAKKRRKEREEDEKKKKGGDGRKRARSEADARPETDEDDDDVDETLAAETGSDWNYCLQLKYTGILGVAGMGPNQVLVVQETWMKIVNRLPDVVYRSRYGT